MALEKKLLTISPVLFTANGTQFGVITVADTIGFRDKQIVFLKSNTQNPISLQVKRVLSKTQMIVGKIDNRIIPNDFVDVSSFTVADSAIVGAEEQDKTALPTDKDHFIAVYESSPVNGDRVIPVDPYGNFYTKDNPIPISVNTQNYDDIVISRDSDGDIVLVQKYLNSTLLRTQALYYDVDKNLIEVKDI